MTLFLALFLLFGGSQQSRDVSQPSRDVSQPSRDHRERLHPPGPQSGTRSTAADKAHTRSATASVTPALSDADLERTIREKLARSKMAADNFTVHVQGGVATLEGKTDIIQRKGAATRIAKTAGASKVVNKIQLSDTAREKASKNLTTGRRRAQVKRSEPR